MARKSVLRRNALRVGVLVKPAVFVVASAAAFGLCDHVSLPYSNPWDIPGIMALVRYNPANNILRFLLFVGAPMLLLGGLSRIPFVRDRCPWGDAAAAPKANDGDSRVKRTSSTRSKAKRAALNPARGRLVVLPLAASFLFSVIIALNIPTFHSSSQSLDTFHEGESLGTSVSLMHGKAPYKDVVFVHGVFQDPLRSVIAFKLFTRSIGAARALESIMKVLCFLALFAFLWVLYEGSYLYAHLTFLALFVLIRSDYLVIAPRDVMTFLFLLAAAVLVRTVNRPEPGLSAGNCVALVLLSFLPVASLVYSIDRGFYLIATCAIMLPLLTGWLPGRSRLRALGFSALGLGLGVLLAGVLLQWQFKAFFDFAILTIPRYKELMDGFPYPFSLVNHLIAVLLLSLNAYWIWARFLAAMRPSTTQSEAAGSRVGNFLRSHLMAICLLLASLCFFRSALGRADWEHVQYSCGLAYILLCYLIVRHWLHARLQRSPRAGRILAGGVIFLVVTIGLVGLGTIGARHLWAENFPLAKTDAEFLTEDNQQALDFLKNHLSPSDGFYTLTSEGSWYYLLDRPSPCRFPVAWFAAPPFYQQEIIRDLQANQVKIILYQNQTIYSQIDTIPTTERLPILNEYIRSHYQYYETVGGNEFWIRKT